MMSGIVGIFMICFGILWTALAAQASGIFAIFGLIWTGIAVMITVYHFKNATSDKRYSQYDITESYEEPDPLNERFKRKAEEKEGGNFCPYCGAKIEPDYKFCGECGKELPR